MNQNLFLYAHINTCQPVRYAVVYRNIPTTYLHYDVPWLKVCLLWERWAWSLNYQPKALVCRCSLDRWIFREEKTEDFRGATLEPPWASAIAWAAQAHSSQNHHQHTSHTSIQAAWSRGLIHETVWSKSAKSIFSSSPSELPAKQVLGGEIVQQFLSIGLNLTLKQTEMRITNWILTVIKRLNGWSVSTWKWSFDSEMSCTTSWNPRRFVYILFLTTRVGAFALYASNSVAQLTQWPRTVVVSTLNL